MAEAMLAVPDSAAVAVALWRALHVELDPPPHVLRDKAGLRLAAPPPRWRLRSGMDPVKTKRVRASVVARARFVEDLVEREAAGGLDQYLILGAGLDTFAQRRAGLAAKMQVFEIDRPGPQAWKRRRLAQLGYSIPAWLHLVPVDFESGDDWIDAVTAAGFDKRRPAVVSALGLSMYISQEAIEGVLQGVARLAPASTLVMSFLVPPDGDDPEERALRAAGDRRTREAGTPFVSSFAPEALLGLARAAGFRELRHVSAAELTDLYFRGRSDGLRPLGSEQLMVARC